MSGLIAFTMPKWGIEMTEGLLAEWDLAEGDAFVKGQLLGSVETEKIVNDIEAEVDATLLRLVAEPGETYPVGALLAVFGEGGTSAADVDAFIAAFRPADTAFAGEDAADAAKVAQSGADGTSNAADASVDTPPALPPGVAASPRALEAAAALGVDLAAVSGCGRNGRIQLQDVEQAAHRAGLVAPTRSGPAPSAVEADAPTAVAQSGGTLLPFSSMRAQIARRLTASYRDIPHFYLQAEAQVDALLAARADYNDGHDQKASLNDFIVRAVALALRANPEVNIHVHDSATERFEDVNVAVAVAIDGGLITPVIRQADALPFADLCAASRALVSKARAGGLGMDDLAGGTFTVSNLGMHGVARFTALINPPQGAILAVGAARPVAIERDGAAVFVSQLDLTLGLDHRAIDGAAGGRFLTDLIRLLDDPGALIGEAGRGAKA